MLYDVFICHAGEDKEDIVRPLAKLLRDSRIEVWFDEFELRVGDSLRRAIDRGLSQSRFGVVVLSPAFFQKEWPQWELDGLVQRDLTQADPLILPVWHDIGHSEILAHSPPLADKVGVSTEGGLQHVATELLKVLNPEGSTLLIARDLLLNNGIIPPVVTDDWWLDVVEYAGGRVAYESWEFPLDWGKSPAERGKYIAWAAMQMRWTEKARESAICQLTKPENVLGFIRTMPGLAEVCCEHPTFLATYAPQLTLPGFGGEFEDTFESWAQEILSGTSKRHIAAPANDSLLNFRLYPRLENRPAYLACQWVQGELFGPHIRVLEPFEYICWILSTSSDWLPPDHRAMLLQGLKEWEVWNWSGGNDTYGERWESVGKLVEDLYASEERGAVEISLGGKDDLRRRVALAIRVVQVPESVDEILSRFAEERFIEVWIQEKRTRRSRNT